MRPAAPCLDGSAAHPVSPGPNQQSRRASAVHQHPARAFMTRAASEVAKAKESHPERRRKSLTCSCRRKGGVCRFSSPARETMPADSECVRGLPHQNAAPSGARRKACGKERVISSARLSGRCGVSPLEGVGGDSVAAPAQGKTFPFKVSLVLSCRCS